MKISRILGSYLEKLATQFPAIAIYGPRQSGKTTLAKLIFPEHHYVNLEALDEREFAIRDPKGFLNRFLKGKGVILDEIQKAPDLLSYIQVFIDEYNKPGQFIITGSQNLLMNKHISQTLAGRIAIMTLLPLSIQEIKEANLLPENYHKLILQGFYPRVYDQGIDSTIFANSYLQTYIERDVREIKNIGSLMEFQKFMRLCAGRIGQLLNMSALANESGISLNTIKAWLSVLEATYVIFLLQPFHNNYNKRIVKMPKLYFYDTAIACNLLKINNEDDLYSHHSKGALFESMVLSNFIKNRTHNALTSNVFFFRDKTGLEIDGLLEYANHVDAIEIKSGETVNLNMFDNFNKWKKLSQMSHKNCSLVYGGLNNYQRQEVNVVSWKDL